MALLRSGLQRVANIFGGTQGGILSRFVTSLVPSENKSVAETSKEVIATCNKLIEQNASRNFAIVHILGKQWRVTDGDLLVVEGYWPPNIGDQITLDKVLVAATKDFSLIGRPLVQPGLVTVTATIISKGLSHTRTHFKKKRRKQFMRINFQRAQQTILRINSVEIGNKINEGRNDV
ncbi:39S ribosomal protein L21, mitochondrial [Bombyx mandarina]|uniref:Large ribosomal subunit protein bL21m n=2 Tax=Bombyx TaxID=7090 RepID=A0A8R2AEX2_BOMMO|nr:39S ribosomal protein L21, mitochondrial [Bombyx mori]XP_028042198.1 39S ribosomal protein L21, mitochondrial [Bombyx mandarina]